MFACRSLIQSELGDQVDFILIDSTAVSVPAPGFLKRFWLALRRVTVFVYLLITKRPDATLIFSSAGSSFIEKGMMTLVSHIFCSNVILAPRSGLLIDNINRSAIFKAYARLVLRSANRIICQGLFWKNYFTSLVGQHYEEKMPIVPNWIDVSRYSPGNHKAGPIVRFIYIGWLERYKGIQDLMEAVRIVKNRKMSFELHVYGDGRLKNWLQNFIVSDFVDSSVVYHGWVTANNKVRAMQEADVIVLPSHREGFPNALLEAMAYQKAVIVSAIGVVPEIIEDHVNGLIFNSGSVNELAERIVEMIQDTAQREQMAYQARQTVIEKYSIESAVSSFRSIFKID